MGVRAPNSSVVPKRSAFRQGQLNKKSTKHVVIDAAFAKDESSILSTSNKKGQVFDLAFFIGGEQGNSLPCVRELSRTRYFAV